MIGPKMGSLLHIHSVLSSARFALYSGDVCRSLENGTRIHWPSDSEKVKSAIDTTIAFIEEEIASLSSRNSRKR